MTSLERRDVLLLEDDECLRRDFATFFELSRYSLRCVECLAEARNALADESFSAVVADLRLPDGESIELLRELRSSGDRTPFLFVTGFASTSVIIEALRLGASDFIEKPVTGEELIARVSRFKTREVTSDEATQAMTSVVGMVTAFCSSPSDVHSIEDFCQIAPIGVSRASFRRRCEALGVEAGDMVRLARLVRAADRARRGGTRLVDHLDVDPRTYRALVIRANVADLVRSGPPRLAELLHHQRLVHNSAFLKALLIRFVQA